MANSPDGPLAGILVVDCSTVLAGPYCTMLLGDLGADVVKVEPPEGDGTRSWGPPWAGPPRAAQAAPRPGDSSLGVGGAPDPADVSPHGGVPGAAEVSPGAAPPTAAYYLAVNRNKRSIRLDLRAERGREVLRRLVARADILVENFRVGGFARLGFDDATLESLNPALVHLAISGYGADGPEAASPGYDFIIQAVSGLMSITGFPDDAGGQPTKVGVAISDLTTGMLGGGGGPRGDRRPGPGGIADRGPRAADRHLPARQHAGMAGEPGAELLRQRRRTCQARQRPPEHRAVRDVRDG